MVFAGIAKPIIAITNIGAILVTRGASFVVGTLTITANRITILLTIRSVFGIFIPGREHMLVANAVAAAIATILDTGIAVFIPAWLTGAIATTRTTIIGTPLVFTVINSDIVIVEPPTGFSAIAGSITTAVTAIFGTSGAIFDTVAGAVSTAVTAVCSTVFAVLGEPIRECVAETVTTTGAGVFGTPPALFSRISYTISANIAAIFTAVFTRFTVGGVTVSIATGGIGQITKIIDAIIAIVVDAVAHDFCAARLAIHTAANIAGTSISGTDDVSVSIAF
jgi:hypothetical protein